FGTRTEIKNVNSFRNVERAIEAEIERQMDILEDGGKILQETRLYDADKNETRAMRSKEVANDYRSFPCPDLLPVIIADNYIEAEIERQMDILEDGGKILQETRLYDADKNEPRAMRSKEVANDYRYFPCPDLLPVIIDDNYIEAVRATLPELPDAKRKRFVKD